MEITVKELPPELISRANSNSFGGNRGRLADEEYKAYVKRVMAWELSDLKKQQLLNILYEKRLDILKQEANHVSVMVAGPAKYNARKLDKSEKILEKTAAFVEWFDDLERQVTRGKTVSNKAQSIIRYIEIAKSPDNPCDPTTHLAQLSLYDTESFIKYYEELYPTYKWRKNSVVTKLYNKAKEGTLETNEPKVFFEDDNLTAYTSGERAYIKFLLKPKRQLIVALKSRGYWWNCHEGAWSTYLSKLDKEWVQEISSRYGQYI